MFLKVLRRKKCFPGLSPFVPWPQSDLTWPSLSLLGWQLQLSGHSLFLWGGNTQLTVLPYPYLEQRFFSMVLSYDGSLFQVHSHLRENPAEQPSLQRTATSPPAQTALVGDPGKTSFSCPVKEGEPGVAQSS